MLNNITFFSSVEFPTTAPSPTIAFPLIKAQCLTSAFSHIIAGPWIYAVGATFALLAIHMSSPLFSYLSSSNFLPNSNIKLEILGKTSHGYIALSINYKFYILPLLFLLLMIIIIF